MITKRRKCACIVMIIILFVKINADQKSPSLVTAMEHGPMTTVDPCTSNNCSNLVTKAMMIDPSDEASYERDPAEPCLIEGSLNLDKNWYGYLAVVRLQSIGGKLFFHFSYPEYKCCVKILLYMQHQVDTLRAHMHCNQKIAVLNKNPRQTITLSPANPSSGCTKNVTTNGRRIIACSGGRELTADRVLTWYIAASSCGSPSGLDVKYSLLVYGHIGRCPDGLMETINGSMGHSIPGLTLHALAFVVCVVCHKRHRTREWLI